MELSGNLLREIESAKAKFNEEYREAYDDALALGFDEKEAAEMASDWVDVKACYSVLKITLPEI